MNLLLVSTRIQLTGFMSPFLCIFLLPVATHAQKIDKSKLDKAARRSGTAARVLTSVVEMSDSIPRELFDRARAVGVFPDLDRISFVMPNSRLAYGVICSRLPSGWSPPAYYGFGAPKIPDLKWEGRKKPDIIVLFMSDQAMNEFQKGNFVFKEEMVGFAGPVGALTPEKENEIRTANVIIYALVDGRVEGLRVDANDLGGGAANPDNNINDAIYGLKARKVLSGKAPLWPAVLPSVSEYQNALINLSKTKLSPGVHVGAQQPERGVDECGDTSNLLRKRIGKVAWFSAKEMKAMAINRVIPKFPKACRCQGTFIIAVKVNAAGKVECARKISGHPLLEAASIEAAKQWSFKPLKKAGESVAFVGLLVFTFKSYGEVSLG